MQVAKIVDNKIVSVETLSLSPRHDAGRWWDIADEQTRLAWMQEMSYKEVAVVSRPADTDKYTFSLSVELVDGVPVQIWKQRNFTEQEADLKEQLDGVAKAAEQNQALTDALLYLTSNTHANGLAWKQPTGVHDAYRSEALVKHKNKEWTSLIDFNVWEPGVSAWREKVTESTPGVPSAPAAWVQPTGAHDAYKVDDKVTHKSKTWINTARYNVWEPGVYGWKEV